MLCFGSLSAKEVPSKLLKGIDKEVDEFTSATTYSIKDCPVKVVEEGDSVYLELYFSVVQADASVDLHTIYILVDGVSTKIEKDSSFTSSQEPRRYMSRASSGTLGTASYRQAQFSTRMYYFDRFLSKDSKYYPIIYKMSQMPSKVKFIGTNGEALKEYKDKDQKKMAKMVALYEALIAE